MATMSMNRTPTPSFDATAIREAREVSASGGGERSRSNSITAPRPQAYPLIRSTTSPYPSHAGVPKSSSPLAKPAVTRAPAPAPAAPAAEVSTSASTHGPTTTQSAAPAPAPLAESTGRFLPQVPGGSVIDPELTALDSKPDITALFPDSAVEALTDQSITNLNFTAPLDIPFQAPLFDLSSSNPSVSFGQDTIIPSAPNAADLLARHPLTLQTALDAHRFSINQNLTHSDPSSTTTSYPPSVPVSQFSSQNASPVTPSDGQSAVFDSTLTSPVVGGGSDTSGGKAGGVPAPRAKKSHARKQPEGHIKRARNAFILFRKHITDSNLIPPSVEVKHQNISVVAAKMWKEAPQDVRAKFQEMARIEKEEHQRLYQPVFRRTDIIRRRVRKDGTEDEKVEAVAEALIKGKAGGELEKEIKEQALVGDEVDTSPESSAARSRSRRRRDPGQLSKGAQRAQKAQTRAKQLRQNLLGHNLLNMSLYNAAQQQHQQQQRAAAAHAHAQAQHAHAQAQAQGHPGYYGHAQAYPGYGGQDYMPAPAGYEVDPRAHGMVSVDPYAHAHAGHGYGYVYPQEYAEEYHGVPRYDEPAYDVGAMDYYGHPHAPEQEHPDPAYNAHLHAHAHAQAHGLPHPDQAYMQGYEAQKAYRLPPLLHQSPTEPSGALPSPALPGSLHARVEDDVAGGDDPRVRDWGVAEQQTPSGHVVFNENLFDGALTKDEGLGDFDQAVEQANEMW